MSNSDFDAEVLRDGEQTARERQQARAEMEQTLVAQEQALQRDTGVPIFEQADTGDPKPDGEDVILVGEGTGSARAGMGSDGSGVGIASPGAGTDDSETSLTHGDQADPSGSETRLHADGERTFEGDGRHALSEQGRSDHAIEHR